MGHPAGRESGDLSERESFELFKEKALSLSRVMDEGKVRYEELLAVAKEIAFIKNENCGFGEITLKFSSRNSGRVQSMNISRTTKTLVET